VCRRRISADNLSTTGRSGYSRGVKRPLVVALAGLWLAAPAGADDTSAEVTAVLLAGQESPELAALRAFDESLFGRAPEMQGRDGFPIGLSSDARRVEDAPVEAGRDLSFLRDLALPDLPIRWDERVVRYLESFHGTARGKAMMRGWWARHGRYGDMIDAVLEEAGLPRDLRCVAMAESGFEPTVRSRAGAAGMWQFVKGTGAEFGLAQTHWVDERLDPERSTRAAAAYLSRLYARFGNWELALASYNMGYGALLRAMRKYNTNDFWELSRVEAGLPFETSHYVSKILACAVVMRNPERFGLSESDKLPALAAAYVDVGGGVPIAKLARKAGVNEADLLALNPELRRGRTPLGVATYRLRIPATALARFEGKGKRTLEREDVREHRFRFGETLDLVARRYRTTTRELMKLNDIEPGERVLPGSPIIVPDVEPRNDEPADQPAVVAVPDDTLRIAGKRRVFYRVIAGDDVALIADFFRVPPDEILAWNRIEPTAALPEGLFVQLFVDAARPLDDAVILDERDVRILRVGSDEFFAYHEAQRGRVRFVHTVEPGESLSDIAKRFGVTTGDLGRINAFGRQHRVSGGDRVVVYAEPSAAPSPAVEEATALLTPAEDGSSDDDRP
jgi:membrane-bound lytic murein transglycosylase D